MNIRPAKSVHPGYTNFLSDLQNVFIFFAKKSKFREKVCKMRQNIFVFFREMFYSLDTVILTFCLMDHVLVGQKFNIEDMRRSVNTP